MSGMKDPLRVIASLVVGANNATSVSGSSRALRTPEDRERFLALRGAPDISLILVGGRSAQIEPYRSAPHPVAIFTRESVGGNLSLRSYIEKQKLDFPGTILCEGGVTLFHLLLRDDLIDCAYISRVAITGDGHFLDENLLQQKMVCLSSETINQTTFEKYERASR
jgi:riboflavin biosynthesis pyrimidine reductase